eukprot:c22718_g1_i1 orf=119-2434(-)
MSIQCLVLGAGQEVGKSCVVVTLGGKTIMFDCGMHMGYSDERRYPDFSLITKTGNFTQAIDCVIITHFHLDHIGALPYFTEVCGYNGPVYMTYPTKALAPLMLEDYRKVMVDRRGEQEQFSVLQIHQCMKKVTAVHLRQTVNVDANLKFRAYYAGHVLGAAMFYVKIGESSVLYTGDYNMTADRHLGAAQIDRVQPDVMITESTYATTLRDSKHARERDFLKAVHDCISAGGKVLIPVFAMGRAQELCILLDEYWERMNLKAPIYFSAGLTMQANVYYKLLIGWTNQKVKNTYATHNVFDFKHVSSFERSQIDASGPCVLFATPGMLSGGLSLEVFKHWAPSERNMLIVPGYCVPGTVGHKLMSGKAGRIDLDKRTQLDVRCQIHHLSFSAHTDAKGIMDLIKHVGPRHVILVHGEKPKMAILKNKISSEFGIPCFDPANSETVEIPTQFVIKVDATKQFFKSSLHQMESQKQGSLNDMLGMIWPAKAKDRSLEKFPSVRESFNVEGVIMMDQTRKIKVMHPIEALTELAVKEHKLSFTCYCPLYLDSNGMEAVELQKAPQVGKIWGKKIEPAIPEGMQQTSTNETMKEVEPVKKKYRMDLQRILSLDLEREPAVEDTEDILSECLSVGEGATDKACVSESFSKQSEENYTSGLNRIDLDINAEPDLTGFKQDSTDNRDESPGVCLDEQGILHAVYLNLVPWIGSDVLKEEEGSITHNSFHIIVCSDHIASKESYAETKATAVLACSWSYEDERLANRVVSLLRKMKFKLN